MVPHVFRGQAITAGWANSLVDQANIQGGFVPNGTAPNLGYQSALLATPWQLHQTQDGFLLCPGPIYVNNILVQAPMAAGYVNSVQNWDITNMTTSKSPEWHIAGYIPHNGADGAGESKFWLINKKEGGSEEPWGDAGIPAGHEQVDIQVTHADGYSIVAGAIFLASPAAGHSMPFDITTRTAIKTDTGGGETGGETGSTEGGSSSGADAGATEGEEITVADIKGGRVYLPGGQVAIVPGQDGLEMPMAGEGAAYFLTLTITRKEDNSLHYEYGYHPLSYSGYTPVVLTPNATV